MLIPVKAIQSFNGVKMNWNPTIKQLKLQKGDSTVLLTVGKSVALINNKSVSLDVPVTIINGRTLVPIRFVSEVLNYNVELNPSTKLITISDRANSVLTENYKSDNLAISRIAALQFPINNSGLLMLTADDEGLNSTYYFPEGKSDSYFIQTADLVYHYEIKGGQAKLMWEAKLDTTKKSAAKDINQLFGYQVDKQYGTAPQLSEKYVFFNVNLFTYMIQYGFANADGQMRVLGSQQSSSQVIQNKNFVREIDEEQPIES
ncbi:copper amine oxidase N-terminal domain-containing protein [Paenibacillus sp. 19GGS1-52]|uniref:copper amine oxidase N-terminal domain-containing protein n=1 Tax=Paenibacillus sp. 19GGS1-52 TaxID=2758563 RepID=UPI001EFBE496|nr:copper amine oxidase N-terminal domain-containing protein [Paenibacillus sp. 19GGS1-52]ULO04960.1 copper amine oxidase N-terminal domain-containing protein [Paenibacillus sp. 19GGS1-52]